jgi:nucleoside-diphosphate-sugar epimerase
VTTLPGDGRAWLNLIYLKDIVDVLIRLANLEVGSEVMNVVDDEPATKQEIVDWLAEEIGSSRAVFDPDEVGPRAPRRTSGQGLPNRRVSNARLKSLLGWQPMYPDYKAGYRDILS